MTKAPQWAVALRDEVSIAEGITAPELRWRRSPTGNSAGGRYHGAEHRVVVTVGKRADRTEQKIILLHELAHAVRGPGDSHSAAFWDVAWRLFLRYRLPVRRVIEREGDYKAECIPAARRAGVRVGAATEAKLTARRRRRDRHEHRPRPRSRKRWFPGRGWYRPCYACDVFVPVEA